MPRPIKTTYPSDMIAGGSSEAMAVMLWYSRPRISAAKLWLDPANQYKEVVDALKDKQADIDPNRLGQYIAASVPLHLMDGWGYLSLAHQALLRGEHAIAIHLAYYAELRGSLSLLGSEGVGVFEGRHIAINENFQMTEMRQGTHHATWALLNAWANRTDKTIEVLTAMSPEGRTISDWLDEVISSTSIHGHIATTWLRQWSLDLRRFDEDKGMRNHVSYRPTRMTPPSLTPTLASSLVEPITECWNGLEPGGYMGSASIDARLLRSALRLAHKDFSAADWEPFLKPLEGLLSVSLHRYLLEGDADDSYLLKHADFELTSTDPRPILARATLLLRLASGKCSRLLRNAGFTKDDARFWLEDLGEDTGLWNDTTYEDSFSDLWLPVELELDSLIDTLDEHPPSRVVDLLKHTSPSLTITQFSRAPYWLLGL